MCDIQVTVQDPPVAAAVASDRVCVGAIEISVQLPHLVLEYEHEVALLLPAIAHIYLTAHGP